MKTRLLYGAIGVTVCAALFSCNKNHDRPGNDDGGKIVYLETNDFHDNANAILAYRQKVDGTLTPLPGSPFLTHGAGLANPKQVLGPDDTDDPVVISSDGRFLFAVNGGSNTVAVFSINPDGGNGTGQPLSFRRSDALQHCPPWPAHLCRQQELRSAAYDHATAELFDFYA
jgi:hypothetical protein